MGINWLWLIIVIPSVVLNIILAVLLGDEMHASRILSSSRMDKDWAIEKQGDRIIELNGEINNLKKSNMELKAFIFANLKELYSKESRK